MAIDRKTSQLNHWVLRTNAMQNDQPFPSTFFSMALISRFRRSVLLISPDIESSMPWMPGLTWDFLVLLPTSGVAGAPSVGSSNSKVLVRFRFCPDVFPGMASTDLSSPLTCTCQIINRKVQALFDHWVPLKFQPPPLMPLLPSRPYLICFYQWVM